MNFNDQFYAVNGLSQRAGSLWEKIETSAGDRDEQVLADVKAGWLHLTAAAARLARVQGGLPAESVDPRLRLFEAGDPTCLSPAAKPSCSGRGSCAKRLAKLEARVKAREENSLELARAVATLEGRLEGMRP